MEKFIKIIFIIFINYNIFGQTNTFTPGYCNQNDPKDKDFYSLDKNLNWQETSFYNEEFPFNLEFYYERRTKIQSMQILSHNNKKIFIIRSKEYFKKINKTTHIDQTIYNDRTDWFIIDLVEFITDTIKAKVLQTFNMISIACDVFEFPTKYYGYENRYVNLEEILKTKEQVEQYLKVYIRPLGIIGVAEHTFTLCFSPCKHQYQPASSTDDFSNAVIVSKKTTLEELKKAGFRFKSISYYEDWIDHTGTTRVSLLKKEKFPEEIPEIKNGYLMNNISICIKNGYIIQAEQENSMDCGISSFLGSNWYVGNGILKLFSK